MKLSKASICAASPRAKPYKLFDGDGLFLLVMPSGGKYWRMKYRFDGKENQISLGVYPDVSLEDARSKRCYLRALLVDGKTPALHAKQEKHLQRLFDTPARFMVDSDGALFVHIDKRIFNLSAEETQELRLFLDTTSEVGTKGKSCL